MFHSFKNILFKQTRLSTNQLFSSHMAKIVDIKNSHILVLQDAQLKLPYLSEVLLIAQKGGHQYKGVVLKTQQKKSYIGIYETFNATQLNQQKSIKLEILNNLRSIPKNINSKLGCIIGCQFQQNYPRSNQQLPYRIYDMKSAELKNQKQRQKIDSLSCVLTVCEDIYEGDMIVFEGGYKSGRTTCIQSMIRTFTQKHQNNISVYMSLSRNDSIRIAKIPQSIVFNQQKITNTSVYSLCIKSIETAKYLSNTLNYNVLFALDGLQDVLVQEWSMLKATQLAISPVSIINELYSCSKPKSARYKGSLTSVVATQPYQKIQSTNRNIQYMQQISMNSNTVKHLSTLNQSIKFPLQLRSNFNLDNTKSYKSRMREYVNKLIHQKKQAHLKRQLKLDKDQPWEYYFILDSQWWVKGLKNYHPMTITQRDDFISFLVWNIDRQICSQWNQDCCSIFRSFVKYCIDKGTPQRSIYVCQEMFEEFLLYSKLKGLLNPFKKDYLP